MMWEKRFSARTISAISVCIALGATVRVLFAWLARGPLHGILIKISLAETLAFVLGLVFGVYAGFFTGAGVIVIADLVRGGAGVWTPFIATIIGLLGVIGGLVRRSIQTSSRKFMGISAVLLTLLSETLQNLWFAWFFNIPFLVVMLMGVKALVTALVQNFVLFTTVGPLLIKFLTTPPKS